MKHKILRDEKRGKGVKRSFGMRASVFIFLFILFSAHMLAISSIEYLHAPIQPYQPFDSHMDTEQKAFTIVLSSLFLTSFFFDQTIRNYVQDELYGGSNVFSDLLLKVGEKEYVYYGMLAVYSANTLIQDSYLHDTSILSLQSLAATQGVTEAFKKTFKRARPRHSPDDPFDFWRKGQSFFSGHSSGAWAFSTVIANRHPEVKLLAYSFAGCVSLSRIYEDAHWASDVLLGALVGYSIGKYTAFLENKYTSKINVLPYVDGDTRYVMIQYRF